MSNSAPICSCIICRKEVSFKGIYTHHERSHGAPEIKGKYPTGNNGKYDSISAKYKETKLKKEEQYLISPNFCFGCKNILPYDKRNNKFCSHSCATTYSNVSRGKRSSETKNKISKNLKGRIFGQREFFSSTKIQFKICKQCDTNYVYPKPNSTESFCSKECSKIHRSETSARMSRSNPNCGGKRNSIKIYYSDSFNNKCVLDSTYELIFANMLDKNNIRWLRPKHLWYIGDDNNVHRYHPDFYLPDFDLYFDPKNDYLIKKDHNKIERVIQQNNVSVIIVSKNNLSNIDWLKSFLEAQRIELL